MAKSELCSAEEEEDFYMLLLQLFLTGSYLLFSSRPGVG